MKGTPFLAVLLVLFIAPSCSFFKTRQPAWMPGNALVPVTPPALGDDLDEASLLAALDRSLEKLSRLDPQEVVHFGRERVTIGRVCESLKDFRVRLQELGLSPQLYEYLMVNYRFFRTAVRQALYTGYYEPRLRGSLQPSPGFPFPLYRRPDDLVTVELRQYSFYAQHPGLPGQIKGRLKNDKHVVPYFSRQEIEAGGSLAGKALEVVWAEDPVEVFFLQIQGSGIVELEDGEIIRVGYSDQNGHPYRSIGKLLLDTGALDRKSLSMQGIKSYLRGHPERMDEILNYNPSYIFFRVTQGGPFGSLGVPLTPGRSIATDSRLFPAGSLALIETEKPVVDERGRILRWEKFRRFVLNQDTGGAIRGPDRVDLFCGSGPAAELTAGSMRQPGTFYFLLKKE